MTGTLPKEGKALYEKIYNKALKYYNGDKQLASKVAWAAVKKQYKKNPTTGMWEKRASLTSWLFDNVYTESLLHNIKTAANNLQNIYNADLNGLEDRLDWDPDVRELLYKAAKDDELQKELARIDSRIYRALLDKI